MSMDRSLRSASSLVRHRNVLTRAERLVQLKDEEKWNESKSVYGLPKVGHRKMAIAKEKTTAAAEGDAAATPAAKAPAGKAAAAAPAAKAAAPAAKGKK